MQSAGCRCSGPARSLASQLEGHGCDPDPGPFCVEVACFSLRRHGFPPGIQFPHKKTCLSN